MADSPASASFLAARVARELAIPPRWPAEAPTMQACRLTVLERDCWPGSRVAREIGFALLHLPVGCLGDLLHPKGLLGAPGHLYGGLVNHGTRERPEWASHT